MGGRPASVGVFVAALASCSPVFKGETTQPNPIGEPTETLRISEPIDVVTGDMELYVPGAPIDGVPVTLMHMHRYPLHNEAQFTVVSRDRLRFHVQVEHKWQEWADLNNWSAKLEDDQGHVWLPEGLDHATTHLEVQMWDYEIRSANYNQFRDVTSVNQDGYRRRQPLGSIAWFRGKGDFTFYQRDLLRPDCRWLKLTIKGPGESFQFTWDFGDAVATGEETAAP